MFGQEPRSDSEFWKIIEEKEIVDEEDLPTPVDGLVDEIMFNEKDDFNDCADIDNDIIQLVQEVSDKLDTTSSVDLSSSYSALLEPFAPKHGPLRKAATNNYLNVTNKNMKHYRESIISETEKFNLNDCVGIKIHTDDRTNIDAKLLPCLIIGKTEEYKNMTFRLSCQYGKLEGKYSVEQFVDFKMARLEGFNHIVIDDLKDITFIEACKCYVHASTTDSTCNCKDKCGTKHCLCKKMEVLGTTKCHVKRGACTDMGE